MPDGTIKPKTSMDHVDGYISKLSVAERRRLFGELLDHSGRSLDLGAVSDRYVAIAVDEINEALK